MEVDQSGGHLAPPGQCVLMTRAVNIFSTLEASDKMRCEIKRIIKMLSPQHQDPAAQSKQQQQQEEVQLIILGQSFLCVILVQLVWLLWWPLLHTGVTL